MSAKNLIVRGGADFSAVQKELNKTQARLSAFQKGVRKTMGGIGLILGGLTVGSLIKDILQVSAKTETLNVAMLAVANATGTAVDVLKEQKRAVMDLGIAEQEATQIMTRFMQANLNTADALKVVRVAQDAGTIAGMNSSDAANQMVDAISKLSPRLLTTFGFTRNLTDIYNDYARALGKTSQQLTEAQKKQAMVNYILMEGEKIAGSYEAAMGTFGKKLGSIDKLSLPKKLMQELKTSLGTPLVLPGAGVALDGIIESLSSIRAWALDNEATLNRWGQSIASAVSAVNRGFSLLGKTLTEHWGAIKIMLTTFASYVIITKAAKSVTDAFRVISLVLRGELMKQIPVLTGVSRGIGYYRLQMALAPAATNIFTGALLRLRVALYAVHVALGPVGWAILAVSAAVSGGMALWGKYANSLNSVSVASDNVGKSAEAAAQAMEDQGKAIGKAGKAAKSNLQGFDEIHQLQKSMEGGGGGEDLLDAFDIKAPGGGGGITGFDLDGLMDEIDIAKPTLKGFWDWMKKGWTDYVQSWGWVNTFSDWVVGTFYDAEKGVWSLKTAWDKWTKYVQSWGWVRGLTDWTVGVMEKWQKFKTRTGETWEAVKKSISDRWSALKTDAGKKWSDIQNTIATKWDQLKKDAPIAWEDIKNSVSNKSTEAHTALKQTWDSVVKITSDAWGSIKTSTNTSWSAISNSLVSVWGNIKTTAENVFNSMKNSILNSFEGIKTKMSGIWNNIWETMKNYINKISSGLNAMINGMNKLRWQAPDWVPVIGGKSWGISIPTIPMLAAGTNYIPRDTLAYLHKGEAVVPKEYNPVYGMLGGKSDFGGVLAGFAESVAAILKQSQPAPAGAGGDIYVYIGNEQVDAYIQRSNDRRNIRSNGR